MGHDDRRTVSTLSTAMGHVDRRTISTSSTAMGHVDRRTVHQVQPWDMLIEGQYIKYSHGT